MKRAIAIVIVAIGMAIWSPRLMAEIVTPGIGGGGSTPTIVYLIGTGTCTNYTDSSGTWVKVDSTNLQTSIVIPTGSKLTVQEYALATNGTVGDVTALAIADGTNRIASNFIIAPDTPLNMFLQAVIAGDGASHTISMEYEETSGTASLYNCNLTDGESPPTMIIRVEKAN